MELRSRDKSEYDELKITLSGLGYFEENMDLNEMRDIIQALQLSETDEFDKALKNSEQPFMHDNLLNSTMIEAKRFLESPPNSPGPDFELVTVQALVHHPIDWSPCGSRNCENSTDTNTTPLRKRNSVLELVDSNIGKRLCYNCIENAPDSGVNLSNSITPTYSPISATGVIDDANENIDSYTDFLLAHKCSDDENKFTAINKNSDEKQNSLE